MRVKWCCKMSDHISEPIKQMGCSSCTQKILTIPSIAHTPSYGSIAQNSLTPKLAKSFYPFLTRLCDVSSARCRVDMESFIIKEV